VAGAGRASKVIAGIDERLADLNRELASHEELIAERERLRAARATLLGESPMGQLSQDDVAAYLAEHPGSRAGEIASALGVSAGRVSAHLYRAKTTRFLSRADGWYLRDTPTRGSQ
jgi:DNA-directed RNA polymerase specialized sigma24 family protein